MNKDIAIIGMSCRFPGGLNNSEDFWNFICAGREAVGDIPADRWNIERFYDPEPGLPGKSIARRGGFLDRIDQFDPQFFGISPREAPYIDPQQRLLLETAWEAMEDAGLVLDLAKGTDIGVYVGISHNDYQGIQGGGGDRSLISAHTATGHAHSIAANRISYCFNLTGPSIAMDTACSAALTAVHIACEQLHAGHCPVALAGGVTVMIAPEGFIGFSRASMLSPEGRCKAFDASADGFVRGEGAGMIALKPLERAMADGDPIYAVIRATAANQDGHTNGISLPGQEAQARLVKHACHLAGLAPGEIGYVEAHGTGTAVGDPIEAHALAEALCSDRPADQPLVIGSVKTNLGHLETAAGVAGLMKAALAVNRGQIPPSLHFRTPNPHIDFGKCRLRVPTTLEPFPYTAGRPRLAAVNSFGFGGANAHVIVAEPPTTPETTSAPPATDRAWPIVLSARSEESLRAAAGQMAAWVSDRADEPQLLPDLVYTLGARRNHHAYRLTAAPKSARELAGELRAFATDGSSPALKTSFTPAPEQPPRIGFVMSGQGPQWWGMGRELMRTEPVFRAAMERCAAAMEPHARFSLFEELERGESDSRLLQTEFAQPAIFAMQVGLAELWRSWGVSPHAIIGHSVGEVAASWLAGIFSLEEAARIIIVRAQSMQDCTHGEGGMLAVGMDESEAAELIARHDPEVSIAAYNGPRSLTLAGLRTSLEKMAAELEAKEVFVRFVRVSHPFHHAMMGPAAEAVGQKLASLQPQEEKVPFFCTVTGGRCHGTDCTGEYWARGVRQPVRFVPAVQAMADHGIDIWLELSPHPALAMSINECLADTGRKATVVSSARREREQTTLVEAVNDLHRLGVSLDFSAMTPSRHLLKLPAYPWNRARWWSESTESHHGRLSPGGRGLLDVRQLRSVPTWTGRLDARHLAFLRDHCVDKHVVFPAAGFIDMALEAGVELFEGRPFAVEDLEIRKPLILPENPEDVVLELTYDPVERTFNIQSRFEPSTNWSLHVVGSLRSERVESDFGKSRCPEPDPSFEPKSVDESYNTMTELGLRYGPEFRGVRELSAGGGRAAGVVSLSETAAKRAKEFALHPAITDAALHVFSAAGRTGDGPAEKLKLPVRFGRILYLASPGSKARVCAQVTENNEELIEGRVELYDSDGRPAVLIEGFRAVSLGATRRSASESGTDSLLYHLDWERLPTILRGAPAKPVPLDDLRTTATRTAEEILSLRGARQLQEVMQAEDDLAAAQVAAGLQRMGVEPGKTFNASALGVIPSLHSAFGRLADSLVRRGALEKAGDEEWRPTGKFADLATKAPGLLQEFLTRHPGHLPEGLLCGSAGRDFESIMRGEKDAVQVLFSGAGADYLEHFYSDSPFGSHWLAAIAAAVQQAAETQPEGRGLRILEVGAGTGGLASYILPLLECDLHRYVFTDASGGFFPAAQQKLSTYTGVEFMTFDLDRDALEQGFDPGTFDFIVATNVLHAAADVRATLRRLHDLLAPGGTLFFMDVATPRIWTESIFGLTDGWWHLKDRDLRPDHPLLTRAQWETVLCECGFEAVATMPGLPGPEGGESQIGVLGRKAWSEDDGASSLVVTAPAPEGWVIFADESGFGDALATQLRIFGADCHIVRKGDSFRTGGEETAVAPASPEDWSKLAAGWANSTPRRIVYLWSTCPADETQILSDAEPLLHLSHALDTLGVAGSGVRIDIVTRGAQPAGREAGAVSVSPGSILGLFRVILSEHPHMKVRAIDLPQEDAAGDLAALWQELTTDAPEREVALRDEARYGQRMTRGLPSAPEKLPADIPLRVESRERGVIDSLRLTPFPMPVCEPGQVLIKVAAAGLNFRDVLKALGLYPAETVDARMYGDEVAGEVVAVGDGVTHVKVGDQVFGLAVFGLATHTLARAEDVLPIPAGITREEAATVPVVFMTAWHALKNVARLRKGETVLVHAGAGGVGMAAIQIARHFGARVIASAGSPAKRSLLITLGVEHVIDSRRGDFAEQVMRLTNGRGVDVVLNALAAEAIPMGLSCLAEFGRFLEIGKRDIYQNSRLPMWHLRRNASFHVVAMDAVFAGDARLTNELMVEITDLLKKGELHPLPFRSYPARRLDAAFRLMAAGKHTGKVLLCFAEPFVPRHGALPPPAFKIDPEAVYLVTGGFGGFGKLLARWLVDRGARHLALTSRQGASAPGAQELIDELKQSGATVHALAADVSSADDVQRVIADIRATGRPLRGVFHLAMVIDDAPLADLDRGRFEKVLLPKAVGGWHLHEATRDMPLDAFVLFSSASSVFGNPGQGNYAAANAFLDSLAQHRHALGLPALTINWGALGGDGYVARNERVAEYLARIGTGLLEPGEIFRLLETLLDSQTAQAAAMRIDWSKWAQASKGMQDNALYQRVMTTAETDGAGSRTADWRKRIEAAEPGEREAVIVQALQEIVGSVLRVKPETLRPEQPLTDLGLDSLMGVEIENMIEGSIGVTLPPTSLLRARTIGQIAGLINEHLGGAPAGPATAAAAPREPEAGVEEIDLGEVGDDILEDLLEETEDKPADAGAGVR